MLAAATSFKETGVQDKPRSYEQGGRRGKGRGPITPSRPLVYPPIGIRGPREGVGPFPSHPALVYPLQCREGVFPHLVRAPPRRRSRCRRTPCPPRRAARRRRGAARAGGGRDPGGGGAG